VPNPKVAPFPFDGNYVRVVEVRVDFFSLVLIIIFFRTPPDFGVYDCFLCMSISKPSRSDLFMLCSFLFDYAFVWAGYSASEFGMPPS